MSSAGSPPARLGVVIVTYNAAEIILDCLETLCAAALADGTDLHVAVVDNASSDNSLSVIRDWAAGRIGYVPPADLPFLPKPVRKPLAPDIAEVIPAGVNGGFAAGVNIGLRHLFADPAIDRVWILNPDSVVPPGTPRAVLGESRDFGLMGGRVLYYDAPHPIQSDGGTINRWTGVTSNIGQYGPADAPAAAAVQAMDFVSGASVVVSRRFHDSVGPMPEDYFLYYEEVDWALRRGTLPLVYAPGAVIYHRAGASIGSASATRTASAFSEYFRHRARMRFVRRHLPFGLPGAWAYTLAKALQLRLKGQKAAAEAALLGAREAPLPQYVVDRLGPTAATIAGR